MGFVWKLLTSLAALVSLSVSLIDLLERFGIDATGWLRSAPDMVAVVPDIYSSWVDSLDPEPAHDVVRMSQSMTADVTRTPAPSSTVAETASQLPFYVSGGVALLAVLVLWIVIPRLFRR
jgi:hypothetical protein